jgi:hypothetical protein
MDADLKFRLVSAMFDAPLVNNAFRGMFVEAMLAQVLQPEWRWCSADWASHDFDHPDGLKLEVKQSAALQSWHEPSLRPNRGRFDVKARTGRYEGARWIGERGRAAQIYIFGWHGLTDPAVADHHDPSQWQFYAVKAVDLPEQKTIALSRIQALSDPSSISEIASKIGTLAA